jgi:hypothetical protein
MKILPSLLFAVAVAAQGGSASAAKYGNALNGKVCILHVPGGDLSKAFRMLLPPTAARAHLANHDEDRRLGASACRLRKPGANK